MFASLLPLPPSSFLPPSLLPSCWKFRSFIHVKLLILRLSFCGFFDKERNVAVWRTLSNLTVAYARKFRNQLGLFIAQQTAETLCCITSILACFVLLDSCICCSCQTPLSGSSVYLYQVLYITQLYCIIIVITIFLSWACTTQTRCVCACCLYARLWSLWWADRQWSLSLLAKTSTPVCSLFLILHLHPSMLRVSSSIITDTSSTCDTQPTSDILTLTFHVQLSKQTLVARPSCCDPASIAFKEYNQRFTIFCDAVPDLPSVLAYYLPFLSSLVFGGASVCHHLTCYWFPCCFFIVN